MSRAGGSGYSRDTRGWRREGGDAALGGLEGERHGEAGVVAQAARDGVAGGFLRGENRQAQDGTAFADEFAGERDAAAGEVLGGAVAFVLGEVEVGLALVNDSDEQREVRRGTGVPGVALPAQRGDVPQPSAHLGVGVLEDVEGVGELVSGVPP